MSANQTRNRKPHENRWLATSVAVAWVVTAAAGPWWNQLIVWLAACAAAGAVSRGQKFGGTLRTMAHLGTGGITMLMAATIAGAAAGTRPDGDLFMRACLIAMTACAAADVVLITWRGRGITPDIDMEEPEDDGQDRR